MNSYNFRNWVQAVFLLASLSFAGAAPMQPRVVLDFVDDPAFLTAQNAAGAAVSLAEGGEVPLGTTLQTGATSAELRLDPNGTVVKIARNTTFRVRTLQAADGTGTNGFALAAGKIRMVAAKLVGTPGSYTISTPTAQAGVRGTDFALEANAATGDWVCVKQGAVEFGLTAPDQAAKPVTVRSGEFANAKAPGLPVKAATAADLAAKFDGLDFIKEDPDTVPGHD